MSYTMLRIDQSLRNNLRLEAWAERWRSTFGSYPPSYKRCDISPDTSRFADALKSPLFTAERNVNSPW